MYRPIKGFFLKPSSDSINLQDSRMFSVMSNAPDLNNSGGWCLGKHARHLAVPKYALRCIMSLICLYISIYFLLLLKATTTLMQIVSNIYKSQYARNGIINTKLNTLHDTTYYSLFSLCVVQSCFYNLKYENAPKVLFILIIYTYSIYKCMLGILQIHLHI